MKKTWSKTQFLSQIKKIATTRCVWALQGKHSAKNNCSLSSEAKNKASSNVHSNYQWVSHLQTPLAIRAEVPKKQHEALLGPSFEQLLQLLKHLGRCTEKWIGATGVSNARRNDGDNFIVPKDEPGSFVYSFPITAWEQFSTEPHPVSTWRHRAVPSHGPARLPKNTGFSLYSAYFEFSDPLKQAP